jgi:hypothetical protein
VQEGGEGDMLQKTMKTVKKAEADALKVVEAAKEKAASIVEDAKAKAASMKEDAKAEIQKQSEQELSAVKQEEEAKNDSYAASLESEIALQKQQAKEKEAEVMKALAAAL